MARQPDAGAAGRSGHSSVPSSVRVRARLSGEASRRPSTPVDRQTFKSLLANLQRDPVTAAQGGSSAMGTAAYIGPAVLETLNRKLRATSTDAARFNEATHHLLRELMDAPLHVQRRIAGEVLQNFADRLSPLAGKARDALLYRADVHDRYRPSQGLPQQYGWEVSPVSRGLYDVQIAAMRAKTPLRYPLYRMPRLDQLAAELERQATDPDVASRHGFAIARMAGFFHQVGYFYHIDKRVDGAPAIHIMAVDSEKRGKEIALQLRDALKGKGFKVNIAAINAGTQFSPAGCPMFSPFNIESMNAEPAALDALTGQMAELLPIHENKEYSNDTDNDVSLAVYNGDDMLWAAFYAVCQSRTTLSRIVQRGERFPDEIVTLENTRIGLLQNFGDEQQEVVQNTATGQTTRKVNFLLERTHEARTNVMLDYLKDLLEQDPAQGSSALQNDIREVRQSSLDDDDDIAMDRPCTARQLADEVGEPVVWLDISALMRDGKRKQDLFGELDRTDGPARMKLGYLQRDGYPVFSDWYVNEGAMHLKDDGYFHRHQDRKDVAMQPSAYMQAEQGIRAGAVYNFIAFPASAFNKDPPAFAGLTANEVNPRLQPDEK